MFLLLNLQSDSDLVSLLLYLILLAFLFCKNVQHFKRKLYVCMKVPVMAAINANVVYKMSLYCFTDVLLILLLCQ